MNAQQQNVIDWAKWETAYQVLWRRIERVSQTGYGSIAEQLKEVTSIGVEAARLNEWRDKLAKAPYNQPVINRRD